MNIKSLILSLVIVMLCQPCVFAEGVDTILQEETTIENLESTVVAPDILTYKEVVEEVVKTLNARDSYFFEIKNPDDCVQYARDLGVILPEDVNQGMTRAEFAVLLASLCEKVTKESNYSTDLIEITDIFSDLEGLSEETIKSIEVVFIEGLMDGESEGVFAPNEQMSESTLKFVLERLNKGYTRENLFSVVDSCFTKEEKEAVLVKYGYLEEENAEMLNDSEIEGQELKVVKTLDELDISLTKGALVDLLVKIEEKVAFEATDLKSSVTIKNVIDYFNVLYKTPGTLFTVNSEYGYYFVPEDTSFLSNEEWEYMISHLDSKVSLSEFLILYDRVKKLETDMLELGYFDSWKKVLKYSKNYLGFVYPMIEKNKDCFDYFLDFDNIGQNDKIIPAHFARTIHECQHEEFLTIAKAHFTRKKPDGLWGTWAISPSKDPDMFYYLDYTTGYWADSKMNTELPATSVMFEHYPEEIKNDSQIKHYGTDEDSSSNSFGIQGLLSEFCSFAVESKVQAVSFALGMNNATFASIDYDSYRKQELMVKDYILSLREMNPELYESFMSDSDVIRTINNILKDLDLLEKLYPWSIKHYTDTKLLDWETVILGI